MRNGMVHTLRRALQQVRQSHQHQPIAQTDSVIDIREGVKAHAEAGHFGAQPQLAIGMLEEFVESAAHRFKLARVGRREMASHFFFSLGTRPPMSSSSFLAESELSFTASTAFCNTKS